MIDSSEISLLKGADGVVRCWWCGNDPEYVRYHDEEWGRPVVDDQRLFEKICLEGFQSGLSWLTILRKRPAFRDAFADFRFEQVALYSARDIERLLQNAGIIRHRGKIEATINNAQQALHVAEEFGSLAEYFWSFRPAKDNVLRSRADIVATSDQSIALSKDLKRRKWKFVGPTTCYAFMQAMGMVNDHLKGCHAHSQIAKTSRPAS